MFHISQIITIALTLFAVIDVLGAIPVLVALKQKIGNIEAEKATLVSGVLMFLFLFFGEKLLEFIDLDVASFALAGSIVIFIIGLEMILGITIFKSEAVAGSVVPIAFPLIAGSGTLTTLISLKTIYKVQDILVAVIINLITIYVVLRSIDYLERKIGPAGLTVMRKFFGIILIAIAIKIFKTYVKR